VRILEILDLEKYNAILKEFTGSTDGPAVFVADYASYNEGHICGTWFDVTEFSNHEEFIERIQEFFDELDEVAPIDSGMPREETMFQDYQDFPDTFYSESCIDENLWEYLEMIDKDDDFENILEAYIACFGDTTDFQSVKDRFILNIDEYYPTSSASVEEKYGWYMAEAGCIDIPDNLEMYFDYESYGRDCLYNDKEHNGYVFSNN
jgi:antirestriction protein